MKDMVSQGQAYPKTAIGALDTQNVNHKLASVFLA